jgi:hypothetical protein
VHRGFTRFANVNENENETGEGEEEQEEKTKKKRGLLGTLKHYSALAYKTKDRLRTAQNLLGEINEDLVRVQGLYQWRAPLQSRKLALLSLAAALLLALVPFRMLFPLVVLDVFTAKWQGKPFWRRMLNAVPT